MVLFWIPWTSPTLLDLVTNDKEKNNYRICMQVGNATSLGSVLHQKTLTIKGMHTKKQVTQSLLKSKGLTMMLKLFASSGPRQ